MGSGCVCCDPSTGCVTAGWAAPRVPTMRQATQHTVLGTALRMLALPVPLQLDFLLYYPHTFPLLSFSPHLFPALSLLFLFSSPHTPPPAPLPDHTAPHFRDPSDPAAISKAAKRAPRLQPTKSNLNLQLICKHNVSGRWGSAGTLSK